MEGDQPVSRKRKIHNRWEDAADLISDLPLNIIHSILALVPIRDAVRTCILSTHWRYIWSSLPHLVFEHRRMDQTKSEGNSRHITYFKNLVTNAILLHQGPIQRFQLSSSTLHSCPDTDRWLLCLSRNGIRELFLMMNYFDFTRTWFRVHSSLYSCRNLTHLNLSRIELPTPPTTFKGFSSLRSLNLCQVRVSSNVVQTLIVNSPLLESLTIWSLEIIELGISAPIHLKCLRSLVIGRVRVPCDVVESLVANSPLLENFTFQSLDIADLRISSPNLKGLDLTGVIREISLYAPLVVQVSVSLMYQVGITAEQQQSSVCNYAEFLGSCTNLKRLVGSMRFTEYLSIGIESYDHTFVFHDLKSIQLRNLNFNNKKQVAVVGHLIMGAPNIHEFIFSPSSPQDASEAPPIALSYSDFGWAPNFKINKLRVIKVGFTIVRSSEMEFIKLLLSRSMMLETMTLVCSRLGADVISNLKTELLSYCRASPNAKILLR